MTRIAVVVWTLGRLPTRTSLDRHARAVATAGHARHLTVGALRSCPLAQDLRRVAADRFRSDAHRHRRTRRADARHLHELAMLVVRAARVAHGVGAGTRLTRRTSVGIGTRTRTRLTHAACAGTGTRRRRRSSRASSPPPACAAQSCRPTHASRVGLTVTRFRAGSRVRMRVVGSVRRPACEQAERNLDCPRASRM
jgi:hypothetical protein